MASLESNKLNDGSDTAIVFIEPEACARGNRKTGGSSSATAAKVFDPSEEGGGSKLTISKNGKGRSTTKSSSVLKLLGGKKGVSLEAIMQATGWQAHSVRGFPAARVVLCVLSAVSPRL